MRPAPAVLQTVQNRLREKTFLRRSGFPVPDFERVATLEDLRAAVARIGAPAMLKTAASGYDGKGQARIATPGDEVAAWDSIGRAEAILEEFVDFEKEVSVVAARGVGREFRPFRNDRELAPGGNPRRLDGAGRRRAGDLPSRPSRSRRASWTRFRSSG